MIKPILFNTEMVRAILDGRKTVTRRMVKFLPEENPNWTGYIKDGLMLYNGNNEPCCRKSPYQPGDILYVRETWGTYTRNWWETDYFMYRADYPEGAKTYMYHDGVHECDLPKWRPSIHMPKEAARLWLKVTDVRVERLQDMKDEDAEKEGLENFCKKCSALFSDCDTCLNDEGIKEDFKELWNSTIKKSDIERSGWNANPWVWVIEFERSEKPGELN